MDQAIADDLTGAAMPEQLHRVRADGPARSGRVAFALFSVALAGVSVLGLLGDRLTGTGTTDSPLPISSNLAVTSPAKSPSPTPPPETASPPPDAGIAFSCTSPTVERLATPVSRHPAKLVSTGLETMLAPTASDGQKVVDGRGVVWAVGQGRLARLSAGGSVVDGWTVADDARFAAGPVVGARGGGVWLVSDQAKQIAWFDGDTFRDVLPSPADGVFALAEAPDQTVWALGFDGDAERLIHWSGAGWTTICKDPRLAGVAVDGRGDVWVTRWDPGGGYGLGLYRFDGRGWTTYGAEGDTWLPGVPPQMLAVAPNGDLWVSFESEIARFDGKEWRRYPVSGANLYGATSMAADAAGVWIAAGRSPTDPNVVGATIVRFDGSAWRTYGTADGLPAPMPGTWAVVSAVMVDSGGILAQTFNGVYRRTHDGWERRDRPTGPTEVAALAAVSSDEVWAATTNGGLWHYQSGRWSADGPRGSPGTDPGAIALGPDGMVAVATDQEIAVRRHGRWTTIASFESGTGPRALAFDPAATLWSAASSTNGVAAYRFDGRQWAKRALPPIPGPVAPTAIAVDRTGAVWVISTGYFPAIERFAGGTWAKVTPGEEWMPGRDIVVDRAGTAWVPVGKCGPGYVCAWGLGAYERGVWRMVELPLTLGYTSALALAPDGDLWAGGSGGAIRGSGERWTSVIDQAYVDRIAIAPDGCAWLSGGVGIVRICPQGHADSRG